MSNFSRNTFDPDKQYVGVRLQQGVPLVDADWNESEDIRRAEFENLVNNFIGDGVPQGSDAFLIKATTGTDFQIGLGFCLVNGYLVNNLKISKYSDQTDLPTFTLTESNLVYLDVWEREVDSFEDNNLINNVIGIETCVRQKCEWRVRIAEGVTQLPTPDDPNHHFYSLAQLQQDDEGIYILDQRTIANPVLTNATPTDGLQLQYRLVAQKDNDILTAVEIDPSFDDKSFTGVQHYGLVVKKGSVALGEGTVASGNFATAMGRNTTASGDSSTAMGRETKAEKSQATAIGYQTTASGIDSTALGGKTTAIGERSTAMGSGTTASGNYSTAMGLNTQALGKISVAMGEGSIASKDYSTAIGYKTTASGNFSTAMGAHTTASGESSTAMGLSTIASGFCSTAMGYYTTASEEASTAMGFRTTASGVVSTAMGISTTASGNYSTAMGSDTTASGHFSTAMGDSTTASGNYSTAMGYSTTASGGLSTAMGYLAKVQEAHSYSFVWSDGNYYFDGTRWNYHDFSSSNAKQFLIHAANGVGINTDNPGNYTLYVNGNTYINGQLNGHTADYAEYFESLNGKEIPTGTAVILDNGKIRPAQTGEIPIGIISANPMVTGGVYTEWPKKYLQDQFGITLADQQSAEEMIPKKTLVTKERQKTSKKTITQKVTRTEVALENGRYCQKTITEDQTREIDELQFNEFNL